MNIKMWMMRYSLATNNMNSLDTDLPAGGIAGTKCRVGQTENGPTENRKQVQSDVLIK